MVTKHAAPSLELAPPPLLPLHLVHRCDRRASLHIHRPRSNDAATMPQDMPPSGGYEPVQYRRNLPVRGFRPAYYLAAVGVIMTYGFYRYGQGIREQK